MFRHRLLSVAVICGTMAAIPVLAADSTSAPHPVVGWQDPTARAINIGACPAGSVVAWNGTAFACTNTITNAANATTAQYANNSGQLNGNGLPTCPAGYALSGNGANWQCVNNVASSNYSTTSGYSNSSGNGVASVSGTTLTTSNGTAYTLPSGGGGGGSGGGSCAAYTPGDGWFWFDGNWTAHYSLSAAGNGSSTIMYQNSVLCGGTQGTWMCIAGTWALTSSTYEGDCSNGGA